MWAGATLAAGRRSLALSPAAKRGRRDASSSRARRSIAPPTTSSSGRLEAASPWSTRGRVGSCRTECGLTCPAPAISTRRCGPCSTASIARRADVTKIAEMPKPTTIVFGTDGWRARVADEYTFENVRRCADGVARYVVDRGEQAKGIVIAYDRRFASEHFAAAAAEVLLAHDIPVAYASHAVPTQMSSYEVVERGSAAGIVITASHNPWTDNGFKIKSPSGSAAGPEILAVLEAQIARNGGTAIERRPFADAEAAGLVERFDPFPGYEVFLRRTLDLHALKAADVHVLVEPMWGAGAGWIPRLLAGGRIRVTEIHQERNPYFGGVNPEPIRPNVDEALSMLAGGGYDLGLLLDGDADRAGAADERGTFIHQLQVTGLLMYYLAEHRGWRDPVVVSVNNTSMAARLGEHYGIKVYETSVGFKYIGPKMIETGAMMGGEESGGF